MKIKNCTFVLDVGCECSLYNEKGELILRGNKENFYFSFDFIASMMEVLNSKER